VHLAVARPLASDEYWDVISDEPTDVQSLEEYGLRFDIAENFLDDKSNGFQLEASLLFLSATYGGRVHDKRIADATPYPLPAGSRLLQELGFLAFTLPHVEILIPNKTPRGQELTQEQERANPALHYRRLRIEHVNSSIKRCRIVKDRIRLWKAGIRDLVMELCCALHNFRVRLSPWQPMV
jgi:DDE superfamily endonuclease